MTPKKLNRRDFLRLSALAAAGGALAACQEKIVQQTVEVPVEKQVEVEVQVTVPPEQVEVTREVEVVVQEPGAEGEIVVTVLMNGALLTEADALSEGMLYTVHMMEYNLQGKGVTARYEAWPGGNEYNTKIRLLTASGEIEDVVMWGNWSALSSYVDDDLCLPLDEFMNAAGVSLDEWTEAAQKLMKYDPDAKKLYQGPVWCLPIMGNMGVAFQFFNQDMLDAAGAPYPTGDMTWLEIEEIATKVAKPDDGIFGLQHNLWGTTHGLGWDATYVAPWGGAILNEEGTECLIDSDECVAAFKWMQDIRYTSRIAGTPDDVTAYGNYKEGTEAGKLAIYQMGSWGAGWFLMRPENTNPAMGFTTTPTSYDNNPDGWRGNTLELNWHAVSSNAKHPAECFDVLYWITDYDAAIFSIEAGQTTPHPRNDSLNDPILDDYPFVKAAAQAILTAGLARPPANLRGSEISDAIVQRMGPVDSGETFPDKAFLSELREEIQAILDMDPA